MEELGRTSRLARRLALAAMICCTASTGNAADPPASESTQAPTFRSLLAEGWSASKSVESNQVRRSLSQLATSQEAKSSTASKPVGCRIRRESIDCSAEAESSSSARFGTHQN